MPAQDATPGAESGVPGAVAAPPRLVLGAISSHQGKTTISLGLMAALRRRGLEVAPAKVGPDYIDPGHHALACGRTGRNLDVHLCGAQRIAPLFLHGSRGADIAVVEGVMGLFDGRIGAPSHHNCPEGSTGHVAALLQAPVLLVVDASRSSRTVAALADGLARWSPAVRLGGVLLNRTSSRRNIAEITDALAGVGLPVLGAVPHERGLEMPSRHLGLVPAAEREQAADVVAAAGQLVARHVDLDAVVNLAGTAAPLVAEPWDPRREVSPVAGRPRVAVAGGRAFTFSYTETTELLEAAGCEVVTFDPVHDRQLPPNSSALLLGGGFPEVHAAALAGNAELRDQVRRLVSAGLPTVAECAGLLYLCRSLDGQPMAGALALDARMGPRLVLGYRTPAATTDTLLAREGEVVHSHEFHRTVVEPGTDTLPEAWRVERDGVADGLDGASCDPAGTGRPTLHASYQHLHWAGFPQAAERLARAAADWSTAAPTTGGPPAPAAPPAPPAPAPWLPLRPAGTPHSQPDLNHHGDADLIPGLVDLAVNVRRPSPPDWLAERLATPGSWGAYPDARTARRALARRHGVDEDMVLPTSGAAEAFTLLARALPARRPLVVHPQFTEPEQALRTAGFLPRRLLLPAPAFTLDPSLVDPAADLVVVGNPTNPTGVLHPAETLRQLARPGRVVLVDEAFMDAVPEESESLLGSEPGEMAGLLVSRSLTKTWGLAGIRAGYVVGDARLVARLERQQSPWSVSTPALEAMVACSTPDALAHVQRDVELLVRQRASLVAELVRIGLPPVPGSAAPFVLVDASPLSQALARTGSLPDAPCPPAAALARCGFAVRRGDTFPGLGPTWIRLAVRDETTTRALVGALQKMMEGTP